MSKVSTLDYALYYASRGFHLFPCAQDKTPLVKWKDEASREANVIRHWYTNGFVTAGIGLVTGEKSGVIVLDVDPGKCGEESLLSLISEYGKLPHTPETLTGGGGRHILFVYPGVEIRNSAGKLGSGLDIRGDGGYIVAPPSLHPSGKRYEWEPSCKLSQTPLAEMPRWMVELLAERPDGEPRAPAPQIPDKITSGARNQTLTSLAGTMRRRGMGSDAIYMALKAENDAKCQPPLSADEIMAITRSVSRYEPTAPPVYPSDSVPVREPLDAFGAGVAFMDLLENLEGRSIKTHISPLDYSLGGIERQTETILAARPSMGKTTLAWQIARNVAASGQRVYLFSLEMSTASLWAKAACGAAGIRWRDVRNLAVSDGDIKAVLDKTAELMNIYGENLLIDDGVNTTETVWRAIEKHHPDLVIIDHLRLLADPGDREHKRLGVITQRLKEASKAFNCGMLICAQLNRNLESREEKRPTLSDLRDSGEIEENADVILMMHSNDYFDPTNAPTSITEILVRKFRDDVLNQRIVLSFDKAHQWFDATRQVDLGRDYA